MARTWSESDWHKEKLRIAREAAKNRMSKKNFDGKSQTFIDSVEKDLFHTAVDNFDRDFKFDKLKDSEKDVISNWKVDDADNYLLGGGNAAFKNSYNPLIKKKQDDFQKLAPLILGVADEGRDWYSMGQEDLFHIGKTLGYDVSTKKGKMDFLRDVGDVQIAHDRGKMLEEFNRENTGSEAFLRELFYPSMMEEIRRQILTGEGTQDQIDKAKRLDRAAAVLMGIAPDVGALGALTKGTRAKALASPMAQGILGAATQGGLEAGRQAIKEKIDPELEADYGAALLASTMGASRPAMIGSASALTQQLPGNTMTRFSRGISAATRRGNPVEQERNMLEELLFNNVERAKKYAENVNKIATTKRAIKNAENESQVIEGLFGDGTLVGMSPAEINKGNVEKLVNERMNALQLPGVYKSSEATASDAAKILKAYDELSNTKFPRIPGDVSRPGEFEYLVTKGKTGDYLRQVDPEYWENIRRLFPMKAAEVEGMGPAYKWGLRTGQLLGDIGGRVEPIVKVNPFGPISGGRANIISNDYKETKWYKSLSKKQQEAFDDAYEKAKKQAK